MAEKVLAVGLQLTQTGTAAEGLGFGPITCRGPDWHTEQGMVWAHLPSQLGREGWVTRVASSACGCLDRGTPSLRLVVQGNLNALIFLDVFL